MTATTLSGGASTAADGLLFDGRRLQEPFLQLQVRQFGFKRCQVAARNRPLLL